MDGNHSLCYVWAEIAPLPPNKISDVVVPPTDLQREEGSAALDRQMTARKERAMLKKAANNDDYADVSVKLYVTEEYRDATSDLKGTVSFLLCFLKKFDEFCWLEQLNI